MKIAFLTPTAPDVAAFGVRSLSSYLKDNGQEVRNIFVPGGVKKYKFSKGYKYTYEEHILKQINDLCSGFDLIGISFMTNYYDRALQMTQYLKQHLNIPVIWGGIHPTVDPERSLDHCDMVCVGEGEHAVLELLQKMESGENLDNIENIWLKKDNAIIKNPMRPLIRDLDSLPFYDFGIDDQYIFDHLNNAIVPMSKELLAKCFPKEPNVEGSFYDSYTRTLSYKTMGSRGCPHHCTYCAERTLALMYTGDKYFRRRSVKHIIDELLIVKNDMPFIESIFLFDDAFTARSPAEIAEFAKEYKEKIGLPFHVQVSPTTLTRDKMDAMIDGELSFIEMGIQSVSQKGMSIYKRNVSKETILDKVQLISEYTGKINPPCYHFILDNPWETLEDKLETLELILKIPPPFWLKRSSLVCFPGTELYQKAKDDGILRSEEDEQNGIYNKHLHMPEGSYINFLFYLAGFPYFPRGIVRLMAKKQVFLLFERKSLSAFYTLSYRGIEATIMLSKGIRALFAGDFERIHRFIKHWYQ